MAVRPTGAVTFLFTDVEGSTAAWEADPEGMSSALEIHDRVIRAAIESRDGFVFSTAGDSFSAAFSSPAAALAAAVDAQRSLSEQGCGLGVRMGVHSGEAVERDGQYFGPPLNRTARLMALGHGGQILVSSTTRDLASAAGFSFLDLGDHRLADLAAPVRVFQLVADGLDPGFPPLRSAVPTDNLPRLGEVFGRGSDIDRVIDLLSSHRVVTLTGAGGIGKTTLAVSVASRTGDLFPDGRWLVDLTDLPQCSDGTAIGGAVASIDERFDSVDALAPRRMLMIVDNCEHLVDGARSYLEDLLATAPGVTVLATSREPLGIRDERVVPVEPLSVDEDSDHASAVDLFVARADQAGVTLGLDTSHDTIAAICREVGGLPLAIELAAARTAVMTPAQVLDRLSDRLTLLRGGRGGPDHHRTIEATIAWSYDLLDPDSQRLLRYLSVFGGGFDLEQAEAVDGDGAVDRLTDLVRKSLIRREDDRFGMLEAVRQYATARLGEAGEAEDARRRHFDFFADWAHKVYHRAYRIELSADEFRWITDNLANLRVAVRTGAEVAEVARAAEIAVVLWPHAIAVFYDRWDHVDWFEPLLSHLDELDPPLRMGVLYGSGTISQMAGEWDRGERLLRAALDLHRATNTIPKTGNTPFNNLAINPLRQGDWDEAEALYREGIRIEREHRLPHHVPAANLARLICLERDDARQALDILREARSLDHLFTPWELADAQLDEADILIVIGEYEHARRLVTGSLRILRRENVRLDLQVWALMLLSVVAHKTGDTTLASTLLLEVLDTISTEGMPPIWHEPLAIHLAAVLLDVSAPDTARRVLDEFKATWEFPFTVTLRRLEDLETRLEQEDTMPVPDHDLPLLDAVRQALTNPRSA